MTFDDLRQQYPLHFARAKAKLSDERLAQLLDIADQTALGHYLWHVFESIKHEVEAGTKDEQIAGGQS